MYNRYSYKKKNRRLNEADEVLLRDYAEKNDIEINAFECYLDEFQRGVSLDNSVALDEAEEFVSDFNDRYCGSYFDEREFVQDEIESMGVFSSSNSFLAEMILNNIDYDGLFSDIVSNGNYVVSNSSNRKLVVFNG